MLQCYSTVIHSCTGTTVQKLFESVSHPDRNTLIGEMYCTAAARGAPRHDQRKVVWGVYDETTRRGVQSVPGDKRSSR